LIVRLADWAYENIAQEGARLSLINLFSRMKTGIIVPKFKEIAAALQRNPITRPFLADFDELLHAFATYHGLLDALPTNPDLILPILLEKATEVDVSMLSRIRPWTFQCNDFFGSLAQFMVRIGK
jgi:hypothetical protein